MIFEPLAGKRECFVAENHTRFTWVKIVSHLLDNTYSGCQTRTLVEDILSSHKPSVFYEVYGPQVAKVYSDWIEFIFTPVHGSWLNRAEIAFSVLQSQCLDRPIASAEKLKSEIYAWQKQRNAKLIKAN